MIDFQLPPIKQSFFEDIKDEMWFKKFVVAEFKNEANKADMKPSFAGNLLKDAHDGYMSTSIGSKNHFHLCGNLAYWLNRNSPVIDWKEEKEDFDISKNEQLRRDFIAECGRAYHAFSLGYRVCLFFESEKNPPINDNYVKNVCLAMKQKDVIPAHAMGLIYRSLFVV